MRSKKSDRAVGASVVGLLFRTSGLAFGLALLAGVLAGLAGTLLITFINRALTPGEDLGRLAWWFAIVGCVLLASRVTSQTLLGQISQSRLYELRMLVCRRVVDAPLRQLEQLGPGRLFGTLTHDIEAVERAMSAIPGFCVDFALALGCFAYQAYLSWRLCLATCVLLTAWTLFNYRVPFSVMTRALARARQASDGLYDHYHRTIDGIKELKLNAERRRLHIEGSLAESADRVRRQNVVAVHTQSLAISVQQLMYLGIIAVLLFGIARHAPLTILMGFVLTIHYLELSWTDIIFIAPLLSNANLALQRIESLSSELGDEAASVLAARPIAPHSVRAFRTLTLRDVRHAYGGDRRFELGPIDLQLTPGEIVIIAGGNGSGKTTFAKILTGLYPPERGEVLVDGEPVTDRERYRNLFAAVFLDSYLFDQIPNAKQSALARSYLTRLKLDGTVDIENGRLSTVALSSGQRRRLMLLMAWLEDRPIYLFDEWAADQDPEFRSIFYDDVLYELKRREKLVVVISHDERFFHVADRVLRFDGGKLIEEAFRGAPKRLSGSHS